MKKIIPLILSFAVVFSFSACKKSPERDETNVTDETTSAEAITEETTIKELSPLTLKEIDPAQVLVVYLNEREGTEEAAKAVAAGLNCDLFEIVPLEPYPEDETEKLERAQNEYDDLLLPALEGHVEDMSAYSVIVAVFPEFGGNMPMVVRTFMEDYDLRRTFVVPVCIASADGAGYAVEQLRSLLSQTPVYDGITITPEEDIPAMIAALLDSEL